MDGARLFAPPSSPPRAVLGARAGRRSTAETAAAAGRALARLKSSPAEPIDAIAHHCAAGGIVLTAVDVCPGCGWGPSFPYPDPEAVAEVLRALLGPDDARAWLLTAARYLEW